MTDAAPDEFTASDSHQIATRLINLLDLLAAGDVTINLNVSLTMNSPLLLGQATPVATGARLKIGERQLSTATLTVDTTNATATVEFVDDKGDTNASAPAGMTAAFSSDNPAALTIAADPNNPFVGDITVVGEGVANVSVALTDANGNSPPLEADGTTPWAVADPVAVTVNPGAAVGDQLSVQGS